MTTKFMQEYQQRHEEFLAKYGPEYDKRSTTFSLNCVEQGVVDDWIASLRAEILANQKANAGLTHIQDMIGSEPYYGAVGGGITYSFTPTSLGTICVVREAITQKELNVAEATHWFFYG